MDIYYDKLIIEHDATFIITENSALDYLPK